MEKEEQTKPKASRREEIMKIIAEINEIKIREIMESANKIKFCFLGNILKNNISLAICDSGT